MASDEGCGQVVDGWKHGAEVLDGGCSVESEKTVVLYQGSEGKPVLRLFKPDGDVFDLTDAVEINARFLKSDGTVLEKKLTVASGITVLQAAGGKIQVNLSESDTELLKQVTLGDFHVEVDIGEDEDRTTFGFESKLTVRARI